MINIKFKMAAAASGGRAGVWSGRAAVTAPYFYQGGLGANGVHFIIIL